MRLVPPGGGQWERRGGKTLRGVSGCSLQLDSEGWGHWRRRWLPAPLFRTSLRNTTVGGFSVTNLKAVFLPPLFSIQSAYCVQRHSTACHWRRGPGEQFHQGLQFRLLTMSPNGVLHYVTSTDQSDQKASLHILKLVSYY